MHCPGHSMGWVITATGVTPDIVLANFFIYASLKQFSKFQPVSTIKSHLKDNYKGELKRGNQGVR